MEDAEKAMRYPAKGTAVKHEHIVRRLPACSANGHLRTTSSVTELCQESE